MVIISTHYVMLTLIGTPTDFIEETFLISKVSEPSSKDYVGIELSQKCFVKKLTAILMLLEFLGIFNWSFHVKCAWTWKIAHENVNNKIFY